jgi:hypothetical protein
MISSRISRTVVLIAFAGVVASVVAIIPGQRHGGSAASIPSAPAGPALKVHLDPATGRVIPPPAHAAQPVKTPPGSSHEGLVEEPGTTEAGGFQVRANGRFRSAVTVTVDAAGRQHRDCVDPNASKPAR